MSIPQESFDVSLKYDKIKDVFEIHDHQHAVAVLTLDYPNLFSEICDVLLQFRFTDSDVKTPGGSESQIPKSFSKILHPMGWHERQLTAKMVVDEMTVSTDTHKVDFVKGDIAFDLEWNSKDQTFDRDLYAFRAFFEYRKIAVAILVTRSNDLDDYFASLGRYEDKNKTTRKYKDKYGASTTHMKKLLPRLDAGRSGGCPVLAIGITQKQRREENDAQGN